MASPQLFCIIAVWFYPKIRLLLSLLVMFESALPFWFDRTKIDSFIAFGSLVDMVFVGNITYLH